VSEQQQTIKKD